MALESARVVLEGLGEDAVDGMNVFSELIDVLRVIATEIFCARKQSHMRADHVVSEQTFEWDARVGAGTGRLTRVAARLGWEGGFG